MTIEDDLNSSELILDGSHIIPKNGGEFVAYQGRKRFFNPQAYKHRFSSERTFAWIDKFRALLIRVYRKDTRFMGAHFVAFSMVNSRHVFAHQ